MKKIEKLSKAEMKNVKGGKNQSCLITGSPCRFNGECCPNLCLYVSPGFGVCVDPA